MPRRPKGEKMVQLSVYVPPSMYAEVSKLAVEYNTTMSNIVQTALSNWLQVLKGNDDRVALAVPKEVHEKLVALAMRHGKSIDAVLLELLGLKKEEAAKN